MTNIPVGSAGIYKIEFSADEMVQGGRDDMAFCSDKEV